MIRKISYDRKSSPSPSAAKPMQKTTQNTATHSSGRSSSPLSKQNQIDVPANTRQEERTTPTPTPSSPAATAAAVAAVTGAEREAVGSCVVGEGAHHGCWGRHETESEGVGSSVTSEDTITEDTLQVLSKEVWLNKSYTHTPIYPPTHIHITMPYNGINLEKPTVKLSALSFSLLRS